MFLTVIMTTLLVIVLQIMQWCFVSVSLFDIILLHSLLYIDKNDTVDTSCSTGDVRLVGGSNEYEGRVEMCYNQMWGTISQNSFYDASDIVCKQLEHQSRGIYYLKAFLAVKFSLYNRVDSIIKQLFW